MIESMTSKQWDRKSTTMQNEAMQYNDYDHQSASEFSYHHHGLPPRWALFQNTLTYSEEGNY